MISSSDTEVKDRGEIAKYTKPYSVAYFIVVCLLGAITGAVATALGTDLLGLYIVLLGFAAFVFLVFSNKDAKFRNLILLAFLLRMGLALFHAYVMPLPDSGEDAVMFERLGWQVAEAWFMGEEAPSLYGSFIYANWIGVLYFIFGRIPLVAQFTNVLLGTFTVYLTWKLAHLITNSRRGALISALIIALFPTLNLYSAITMRESFIVFFTVTSAYCFFLWLKRGRLMQMFGAVTLLLPASALHGGMVFIEIVYLFFFSFYHPKKKRWVAISLNSLIGILLITLAVFGGLMLTDKLPKDISLLFSADYLGERTQIAARDRAAYLTSFVPTSPLSMLLQTPLRILYFLYTPFVWMVSAAVDIVGFFDALLYIFLSIYTFKGLASLRRKDKLLFWGIVLILVVFLVVFAWGTSNYGTAIRHRQKIVWLLSVPAAIGIAKSRAWRWIYPVKRLYRGKTINNKIAAKRNP
ncbi:glycosyltransferase family 39 protein [Acetomicrobium sp.]|uniref:glycosyltransferase family 39 protein n=1 Tax=Acetomicrobium sp. TaxID=1872099 RepID=UPI001BD0A4EB|nr:glycosyltransferase family 39 protein [Acetomicrobium sp.]